MAGRIQVVHHSVSGHALLSANVYGYPSGPTYPDAHRRTNALLSILTEKLVLGRTGLHCIVGDYSANPSQLDEISIWRQRGWIEVQELAWNRWARVPQPTCQGRTARDFVFLSPELAALCVDVLVQDHFQEHSTVSAAFKVPSCLIRCLSWLLPGEIPWSEVDTEGGRSPLAHQVELEATATERFAQFSQMWERSLSGFVKTPGGLLPKACFGRGQRLTPQAHHVPSVPVKASRSGDEVIRHGLLGLEVKKWFQQLRRLQSLKQSVEAGNVSPNAVAYRLELWAAVRRAKGFKGGFPAWWQVRPTQLQASPLVLPLAVPTHAQAIQIFLDYRDNFRRFEAWRIRQRCKALADKHETSSRELLRELHDPSPAQVDSLQITRTYANLAADTSCSQLHVDPPIDDRGISLWRLDDVPVSVLACDASGCTVQVFGHEVTGDDAELSQVQTLAALEDVQTEFVSLRAPRS